jgi:glycerol-3-phosphate dehydrogenase
MKPAVTMDRAGSIDTLRKRRFDVLVIGGGITGAGVAMDAASRGMSVALIEKNDFSSGTSSRSSKVIHGGLRYLKQLQFGVTREAVRERETLMRMAPHLVRSLPILMPYRRGVVERTAFGAALTIYDAMGSSLKHVRVDREVARKDAPLLATDLAGAFRYFDATADDSRLVMHVIKKAVQLGATVANYARLDGFQRMNDRSLAGVTAHDSISGATFAISAAEIVNAAGVWVDTVRQKLESVAPPLLRPSKGVHIVVANDKLRVDGAVAIPKTRLGQYLWIAPWQGRTIIGTTDTDYQGDLDNPEASPSDIALLLEGVAEWFPAAGLTDSDIISTYAGLRPLHVSDAKSTSAIAREVVIDRRGGLLTVSGGKLTTFRTMAKRVVDLLTNRPCETEKLDLFGSLEVPGVVQPDIAQHLHEAFGSEAHVIAAMDGAGDRLLADHPHTVAEVDYVIRSEMAMTVDDVLSRRTRLALIARDKGERLRNLVAEKLNSR